MRFLESIPFVSFGKELVQGGVKMPGDPKECRQHAERCAELAPLITTPEARDTFLSLQMTWIRLASELDKREL